MIYRFTLEIVTSEDLTEEELSSLQSEIEHTAPQDIVEEEIKQYDPEIGNKIQVINLVEGNHTEK